MPEGTPFLFGRAEIDNLTQLRHRASQSPVDMRGLVERLKRPEHKAAHMRQMNRQSIVLPFGYLVTYSVEKNHPIGTCRHMSMSSPKEGRLPNPEAVWMVAEALGFVGSLEQCTVWLEDLQGHGKAVNVVQPLAAEEAHA